MKEGKTKQIDELVDQVLRNMGLEQKFKEHEVCMIWPEVVGQMIASRTKSVRVKEGLIRALNEKVGKEVVKEMIIN